jgi:hypothetical protein
MYSPCGRRGQKLIKSHLSICADETYNKGGVQINFSSSRLLRRFNDVLIELLREGICKLRSHNADHKGNSTLLDGLATRDTKAEDGWEGEDDGKDSHA